MTFSGNIDFLKKLSSAEKKAYQGYNAKVAKGKADSATPLEERAFLKVQKFKSDYFGKDHWANYKKAAASANESISQSRSKQRKAIETAGNQAIGVTDFYTFGGVSKFGEGGEAAAKRQFVKAGFKFTEGTFRSVIGIPMASSIALLGKCGAKAVAEGLGYAVRNPRIIGQVIKAAPSVVKAGIKYLPQLARLGAGKVVQSVGGIVYGTKSVLSTLGEIKNIKEVGSLAVQVSSKIAQTAGRTLSSLKDSKRVIELSTKAGLGDFGLECADNTRKDIKKGHWDSAALNAAFAAGTLVGLGALKYEHIMMPELQAQFTREMSQIYTSAKGAVKSGVKEVLTALNNIKETPYVISKGAREIFETAKQFIKNPAQVLKQVQKGVQSIFSPKLALVGGGEISTGRPLQITGRGNSFTSGINLTKKVYDLMPPSEQHIIKNTHPEIIQDVIKANPLLSRMLITGDIPLTEARTKYFLNALLCERVKRHTLFLKGQLLRQIPKLELQQKISFQKKVETLFDTLIYNLPCLSDAQLLQFESEASMKSFSRQLEYCGYDVERILNSLKILVRQYRINPDNVDIFLKNLGDYCGKVFKLPNGESLGNIEFQDILEMLSPAFKQLLKEGDIRPKDISRFIRKFKNPEFVERFTTTPADKTDLDSIFSKYLFLNEDEWHIIDSLLNCIDHINTSLNERNIPVAVTIGGGRSFLDDLRGFSGEELNYLFKELKMIFRPTTKLPKILEKYYLSPTGWVTVNKKLNPQHFKKVSLAQIDDSCELRLGSIRAQNPKNDKKTHRILFSASKIKDKLNVLLYRYFTFHEEYDRILKGLGAIQPSLDPLHEAVIKVLREFSPTGFFGKLLKYKKQFGISTEEFQTTIKGLSGINVSAPGELRGFLTKLFPESEYEIKISSDGLRVDFEVNRKPISPNHEN